MRKYCVIVQLGNNRNMVCKKFLFSIKLIGLQFIVGTSLLYYVEHLGKVSNN